MNTQTQKTRIELIEESIRRQEARFSPYGGLITETGKFTGRATKERFVMADPRTDTKVHWGEVNRKISSHFGKSFFQKMEAYLTPRTDRVDFGAYVGPFEIELTTTSAWHALFASNMFRNEPFFQNTKTASNLPKKIRIFHAPYAKLSELNVEGDSGQKLSDTLILLDLAEARVGIIGTAYAGEIKKSAFSVCNFLMPELGIFPMHASANCLTDGKETCVMFGLSGTGKTTLSAANDRLLIGDDEIIWTDTGISNLEGGCYAKLIDLTLEREPQIFRAIQSLGAILENVDYNPQTRAIDFASRRLTENTRGSYPLTALDQVFDQRKEAEHPTSIVFLTADAFGCLPVTAKLTPEEAEFYFMSGYTARVAGTELGVKEPQAVFSPCFGAPFMPRHPREYARLLSQKIQKSGAEVWILNTGWLEGGFAKSPRISLSVSRRLLQAIQRRELSKMPMVKHPIFGFEVPTRCEGIPSEAFSFPKGPEVAALFERFKEHHRNLNGQRAEETREVVAHL